MLLLDGLIAYDFAATRSSFVTYLVFRQIIVVSANLHLVIIKVTLFTRTSDSVDEKKHQTNKTVFAAGNFFARHEGLLKKLFTSDNQ